MWKNLKIEQPNHHGQELMNMLLRLIKPALDAGKSLNYDNLLPQNGQKLKVY